MINTTEMREQVAEYAGDDCPWSLIEEALDEIDALRAEVERLKRTQAIAGMERHFLWEEVAAKEEIDAMTDQELWETMAMCGIEPADSGRCPACYAFKVSQDRGQAVKTS